MSKNIHQRLDQIEEALQAMAGDDAPAQWKEMRDLFTAEPDNSALLGTLGAMAGTRSLPRLLALSRPDDVRIEKLAGELRSALGRFCRTHRYQCPQSKLIRIRHIPGAGDRNAIVVAGEDSGSKFLQIWEAE
jgi:hypothetical protein